MTAFNDDSKLVPPPVYDAEDFGPHFEGAAEEQRESGSETLYLAALLEEHETITEVQAAKLHRGSGSHPGAPRSTGADWSNACSASPRSQLGRARADRCLAARDDGGM